VYGALTRIVYRHRNLRVIVQNRDDWDGLLVQRLVTEDQLQLIPGSGVDLGVFRPVTMNLRRQLVVLPARMLSDKGVTEFVAAARTLRRQGCAWSFALVGSAESENPSAIPASRIKEWVREGVVEWWGHRQDMPEVLQQARIVCLPSYREGMPKALLEAAAAGCAVVTTDAVGCREAIRPGVTGDLVPPRDAEGLARTLQALMDDQERCARYGEAGRRWAEERFGIDAVVAQTLAAYEAVNAR
jgi:glycosyltransferase involved in cell wall biosynthesis